MYDYNRLPRYRTWFYTDGSKTNGRVGTAVVKYVKSYLKEEILVRLSDNSSVFQAELTAIKAAIMNALEHNKKEFDIFSDSLSSLKA